MAHNVSEEKRRRERETAAADDRRHLARTLTVAHSSAGKHVVKAVCECGRERHIPPDGLVARGLATLAWRDLLKSQRLVCAGCGRGFRCLKLSHPPEPFVEIWRDK